MKYPYAIEKLNHGGQELTVMRLPAELSLVETFLFTDVNRASGPQYLDAIGAVLRGESDGRELSGNACTLEIGRERTRVVDELADEDSCCELETEELQRLIEAWLREI